MPVRQIKIFQLQVHWFLKINGFRDSIPVRKLHAYCSGKQKFWAKQVVLVVAFKAQKIAGFKVNKIFCIALKPLVVILHSTQQDIIFQQYYQSYCDYSLKMGYMDKKQAVYELFTWSVLKKWSSTALTLFTMGFFGSLSLKSVTHILQLWNLNHVKHPFSLADNSIFSLKITKFCFVKTYR